MPTSVSIIYWSDIIILLIRIDFNLDFYTEVMDLDYLHQYLDQNTTPMLASLNKAICNLIKDFSLVSFIPLNIQVCSVKDLATLLTVIVGQRKCT